MSIGVSDWVQVKKNILIHIGEGHRNNCQIILRLFGVTYFVMICSTKKFQANLQVSEVLITCVTNRRKTRAILHMEAGHSNNH